MRLKDKKIKMVSSDYSKKHG